MKICTICKLRRRQTSFYRDSRKRDGLQSSCKSCIKKRYRPAYSKKDNETWKRYARSAKGIRTLLLNNAKDRAKRNDIPFDLDHLWLEEKIERGICELSGLPFVHGVNEPYRANPFGPSIDRKKPEGGYTKANCRLICFCVNMARSDWGDEILLKMAKALIQNNPSL